MVQEAQRKREEQELVPPPRIETPRQRLDALRPIPVRKEVRMEVERSRLREARLTSLFRSAYGELGSVIKQKADPEVRKAFEHSELSNYFGKDGVENLFRNCKTQFAYDDKQKIYSVTVMLEGRPRILTLRVNSFTELSLFDPKKGEVLETLRQDGNSVTFSSSRL